MKVQRLLCLILSCYYLTVNFGQTVELNGVFQDDMTDIHWNVTLDIYESLSRILKSKILPRKISSDLENFLRNVSGYDVTRIEDFDAGSSEFDITTTPDINDTIFGDDVELIKARFRKLYPIQMWKDYGWYEDDYLDLINIHWLQFSPPPVFAHYILAIIYSSIAFCGFIGNILVIFMFFKCQSLRTPANILVVNLALSDFLMISKTPLFIYNSVFLGPATGKIGCQIYGFVGGITGTVSIGTLAAIAFDRYSVVVYPLEPLRSITKFRAKLSAMIVWVYGCFFSVIPVLDIGLGRYVPEGYLTSCSFDYLSHDRRHRMFIFAFFCAAWLFPLIIISFCYIKILSVVLKNRSMGDKFGSISSRHCKEKELRKSEIKLAIVVIGVIALFFIAWTPYSIVALLGISGYEKLLLPTVSMIPAIFCKVASCIDPFVYILTHPKFRQECKNLLLTREQRRRRNTLRSAVFSINMKHHHNVEVSNDDIEIVEVSRHHYTDDINHDENGSKMAHNKLSLRKFTQKNSLRTVTEDSNMYRFSSRPPP